jgi:hypothetical protein
VTKSWPDFFEEIKTLGAESAEIEMIGGTHLGT